MNKFIGIGTLPRNGRLNGSEKKVLYFTLATPLPPWGKDNKPHTAFVPCVVFKPSDATISLINGIPKGVSLGLKGRVNTSKFEAKDGKTRYQTEIIVDERSLVLLNADELSRIASKGNSGAIR